jgi:hypothetical protein
MYPHETVIEELVHMDARIKPHRGEQFLHV